MRPIDPNRPGDVLLPPAGDIETTEVPGITGRRQIAARRTGDAFGGAPRPSPEPGGVTPPSSALWANATESEKLATELFLALHGAWGGRRANQRALGLALARAKPEGWQDTASAYRRLYQAELAPTLAGAVGRAERERLEAWLSGDLARAEALALESALAALPPRAADLFAQLERAAAERRTGQLARAYHGRTGRQLKDDIDRSLRGDALLRATALLRLELLTARAALVHEVLHRRRLGGLTATELAALRALLPTRGLRTEYARLYQVDLRAELDGLSRSTDAAVLRAAMTHDRTALLDLDLEAILLAQKPSLGDLARFVRDLSGPEREALLERRRAATGRMPFDELVDRFGKAAQPLLVQLLRKERLGVVDELQLAILAEAPDVVVDLLEARSQAELASVAGSFERRYGRPLDAAVRQVLKGAPAGAAELLMRGRPETVEQALDALHARHAQLREGLRNAPSRFVLDSVLHAGLGPQADALVSRLAAELSGATSNGALDDDERSTLAGLWYATQAQLDFYGATRRQVRELGTTVIATAALGATSVATAGAAPLVAGTAAAAVGIASRALSGALLGGADYGRTDLVRDLAVGATAPVGLAVGARVADWALAEGFRAAGAGALELMGVPNELRTPLAERLAGDWVMHFNRPTEVAVRAVDGAIRGATTSATMAASRAAATPTTWEEGVAQGLRQVASTGARAMPLGMLVGASVSGLSESLFRLQRLSDLTAEEQARYVTQVDLGNGQQVYVVGTTGSPAVDATLRAHLAASLRDVAERTAGEGTSQLTAVYVLPDRPEYFAAVMDRIPFFPSTTIEYNAEVVAQHVGNPAHFLYVAAHETGHLNEALRSFELLWPSSPFVDGHSAFSAYGAESRFESLGDAHSLFVYRLRDLVDHRQTLLGDVQPTPEAREVAQGFSWISDQLYPGLMDRLAAAPAPTATGPLTQVEIDRAGEYWAIYRQVYEQFPRELVLSSSRESLALQAYLTQYDLSSLERMRAQVSLPLP